MDDAREWTVTAPRAGAGTSEAVQPGDPWDPLVWGADPRAVGGTEVAGRAPAGIWRRGVALLVDLVLVAILLAAGSALATGLGRLAPRFYLVAQAFGIAWQLVVPAAYFVLSHGTAGQTLGKRLLGARVVDEGGEPIGYLRALGRGVATLVAALPLGIGLLAAGLRRDRRGLHDFLAGTQVVRVP